MPTLEFTDVTLRGAPFVVLRNPPSPTYFQCDPRVARTLRLFDGSRTVEEAMREAGAIMGGPVEMEDVEDLLARMAAFGFLEGTAPVQRDPVRWRRVLAWRVWEFETGAPFERFARLFAPVFAPENKRLLAALLVALLGVFAYVVVDAWASFQMAMMLWSQWQYAVGYLAMIAFVSILHEAAHAIAYVNHGGRRPRFGVILFLLVFLAAFTDVADAYRFKEKWRRISVSLAGVMANLVLGIPAILLWSKVPGVAGEVVFFFGMVNAFMVVFSLFPAFRSDMYYVLVDVFETPNLQQRSVRYLVSGFKRVVGVRARGERPDGAGQAVLFASYGAVSLALILVSWWGLALQVTAMSPAATYLEEHAVLGYIPGARDMNRMTVAMDGMSFREMMAMVNVPPGGMGDGHMGMAGMGDMTGMEMGEGSMDMTGSCEAAHGKDANATHEAGEANATTNESAGAC